jgi:hypothetical protein
MVKNTVQRDEKRVIIYFTFDDEQTGIQDSVSGSQPSALAPQPSARERSDNE